MGIELEHGDMAALHGVQRIRAEWNELFRQRLSPKKYKFKPQDEKLIETIAEILTNEGKFEFRFSPKIGNFELCLKF